MTETLVLLKNLNNKGGIVLSDKTIRTHLGSTKTRLEKIKYSLEEMEYWVKENDLGVMELIKKDIKTHHIIIKRHLEYLSRKF